MAHQRILELKGLQRLLSKDSESLALAPCTQMEGEVTLISGTVSRCLVMLTDSIQGHQGDGWGHRSQRTIPLVSHGLGRFI